MNVGKMDSRITIQTLVESADAIGYLAQSWTDLATVWADVTPVSGTEVVRSERKVASRSARFYIRYRSDITPKHRISYDGEFYEIRYLREVGRSEGLEILGEVPEA
jgi:SPP1 family predicted phage head-tail adaptor